MEENECFDPPVPEDLAEWLADVDRHACALHIQKRGLIQAADLLHSILIAELRTEIFIDAEIRLVCSLLHGNMLTPATGALLHAELVDGIDGQESAVVEQFEFSSQAELDGFCARVASYSDGLDFAVRLSVAAWLAGDRDLSMEGFATHDLVVVPSDLERMVLIAARHSP